MPDRQEASSAAQDRLRDLRYCLDVLHPEARRLEAEQWDCIGIPWRFRRWRRAYRAHKAINEQWRAILASHGVEVSRGS